ncbi:hypothetical protein [Borreliella valaisiana]|uniref:hypothetical protein n=1 Tax=Borreliella valaisiana TaxID=62088 RepID=UPI001AED96F9|nr:hypothetical protein [Borreliella valaisiana]
MCYIKKYLIFLLLNLVICNLFNKNKNSDQKNNIISNLDSNQKQALAFFKDLVQNKQYSKDLEQASKSFCRSRSRKIKERFRRFKEK